MSFYLFGRKLTNNTVFTNLRNKTNLQRCNKWNKFDISIYRTESVRNLHLDMMIWHKMRNYLSTLGWQYTFYVYDNWTARIPWKRPLRLSKGSIWKFVEFTFCQPNHKIIQNSWAYAGNCNFVIVRFFSKQLVGVLSAKKACS